MSKINADRGPQYAPSYPLKGLALDKNPLTEKDQSTQCIPPVSTITPTASMVAEVPGAENVPSVTAQLELMEATKLGEDDVTDSESEGTESSEEGRQHKPLGSWKKKPRERLVQLLEDRMAFMEKELIDLRSQLQSRIQVDDQTNLPKQSPVGSSTLIPQVQESVRDVEDSLRDNNNRADHYTLLHGPNVKIDERDWVKFSKGDPSKSCVIEVLTSEIGYGKNRMATGVLRRGLTRLGQHVSTDLESLTAVADVQIKLPHRIWIHSRHIIKVLEKVTSHKTRDDSVIMLAPFKSLVLHDAEIRTELKKLETLFPNLPDRLPLTPAAEESENQVLATKPLRWASRKSHKIKQEPMEHKAFTKQEFKEGTIAVAHIRLLVQFMDIYLKSFATFRRQLDEGNVASFAFAHLFLMFGPGVLVFSRDRRQAFEVISVSGGLPLDKVKATSEDRDATHPRGLYSYNTHDITSPFIIDCYRFDFDGVSYGPVQESFAVSFFSGEKPVSSLPVVPLNCLKDGNALKEELTKDGIRFLDMFQNGKKFAHKVYEGLGKNIKGDIEEIDSQIIVDFSSAFQKHPAWKPRLGLRGPSERDPREMTDCSSEVDHFYDEAQICIMCEIDRFWPDEQIIHLRCNEHVVSIRDEIQITQDESEMRERENQLLLLPSTVYGFALRGRKWVALDMNNVQDIVRPEEGFEDLVINEEHKLMVQALVKTHSRVKKQDGKSVAGNGAAYQSDLVGGKGRGRVLLLHGPPGVGKTSTAECVADLTGRPLFQITCGDIGTEPVEVEEKLDENFQLAHRWDCVLLLDEADVFLQERDRVNLKRNSLVSVFLRVLEYYPGLLFLTTNREGILDEAFKSRIHIALHYERPDLDSWLKIWTNNIKRAQKHYKINEKKIKNWAQQEFSNLKWNGRQIRNAFQAAIALAEFSMQNQSQNLNAPITAHSGIPQPSEPIATTSTKRVELKIKHFEQVAKVSMGFDAYIDSIYGYDTLDDRVKRGYLRNDRFSSTGWGQNYNNLNNNHFSGSGMQNMSMPPQGFGFGNHQQHTGFTGQRGMAGMGMQQQQQQGQQGQWQRPRKNERMNADGMYGGGGGGGHQQHEGQGKVQGGFNTSSAGHNDDGEEEDSEDSDG